MADRATGTRCLSYFLRWAEKNLGREGISTHIHTYIAIGPLFLGAPKSVRATVRSRASVSGLECERCNGSDIDFLTDQRRAHGPRCIPVPGGRGTVDTQCRCVVLMLNRVEARWEV